MHKLYYPDNNWCFPDDNRVMRSRHEYRYSFDAYYLWVNAQVPATDVHAIYTDRMKSNKPEKFNKAMKAAGYEGMGRGVIESFTHKEAQMFAETYYDDKSINVVALGVGCNHSNGYPIPILFINRG